MRQRKVSKKSFAYKKFTQVPATLYSTVVPATLYSTVVPATLQYCSFSIYVIFMPSQETNLCLF